MSVNCLVTLYKAVLGIENMIVYYNITHYISMAITYKGQT